MFDKFHEECGVVAIYGHPEAAKLAYLGLYALQHRGQESAGICTTDGARIYTHKSMGHVADIFTSPCWRRCPASWPSATRAIPPPAIRCCSTRSRFRWPATRGGGRGAQRQHHQRLPNCAPTWAAAAPSSRPPATPKSSSTWWRIPPSARWPARCATRCCSWKARFRWCSWPQDRIIVARDPHGFRPLAVGEMEISGGRKCYVFASETCAFDLIGAVYLHDVEPGEMVIVGPKASPANAGRPSSRARSASSSTSISRGPIPWSSAARWRNRARTWAACWRASAPPMPTWWCRSRFRRGGGHRLLRRIRLPFRQALIRNHYVGRTFIEPSQAIRDFGVKLKLNPVRYLLQGQRVVLVDDSIVRGTTSRKIVRMVRQAGAREVHLRISCPPTISPCFYGVDTPTRSELIGSNHNVEEIRRFVEADSLGYLSLASLRKAVDDESATNTATPATPATIRRSWSTSRADRRSII
jgi:amidophosphoribosyltransferase